MSFENSKNDWNISEPQLIIPMTDTDIVITKESDKFLSSSIPLNTLNPYDQILLPNSLENGLVIELDCECFENLNKKEVLVIQNSNLKLQPFNSESGNSTSYTLSYIDQEKNEVYWEGLLSKETNKSDFEYKGLQFTDSATESSKTWQKEFVETESNITSGDKAISTSQNCETEEKIILAVREVNKNKSCTNNVFKDSYLIDNYSTLQGSFVQEPDLTNDLKHTESKILVIPNENIQYMNFNKTLEIGSSNTVVVKKNLPLDFREASKNNIGKELFKFDVSYNCLGKNIHCEKKRKEKCVNKTLKGTNAKGSLDCNKKVGSSDTKFSLPEKSLPLKKKAKMKNTVISLSSEKNEISKSFLKDKAPHEDITQPNCNLKLRNVCILRKSIKDKTNRLLKCKWRKKKKDAVTDFAKGSVTSGQTEESKFFWQKDSNALNKTEDGCDEDSKEEVKSEKLLSSEQLDNETQSNPKLNQTLPFNFYEHKFDNIYDLVEGLRKCKMINSSLWQILNSGLKEMDVDILQEMRNKGGIQCLTDSISYSAQLKAFALILYFKQPAAFHFLANIYKNGWPSLRIIKEWKRRINCIKRANFIASQKEVLKS